MSRQTDTSWYPPVFVGGTGRSGTTIIGRLIGAHSRYAFVPIELRFHAEPLGLQGLFDGSTDIPTFVERMRSWLEQTPQGRAGGLKAIIDPDRLDELLGTFAEAYRTDRVAAARDLVGAVVESTRAAEDKPSWVEMTPRNVFHGQLLLELFPGARIVHAQRDGRDAAASLVAKRWSPDMFTALRWWADRVIAAHRFLARLPPGSSLDVHLEDLVGERRDEVYAELVAFLGVDDEPAMRTFFDEQLTLKKANVGRWRGYLEASELAQFEELYAEISERLPAAGTSTGSGTG